MNALRCALMQRAGEMLLADATHGTHMKISACSVDRALEVSKQEFFAHACALPEYNGFLDHILPGSYYFFVVVTVDAGRTVAAGWVAFSALGPGSYPVLVKSCACASLHEAALRLCEWGWFHRLDTRWNPLPTKTCEEG